MPHLIRSTLWLGFFAAILAAWWMMYSMAMQMDLDLFGRPGAMGAAMAAMDPRMDMAMPMAEFGPLFAMWAIMMAAMMLPTMVPTLRSYEDLMVSADGTRAGWLGVIAGYLIVWIAFAALIAGAQLALLFGGVIDMLGIPKSHCTGVLGGVLMGLGLGAFCVGCCWGFMALGFVGGVMSLLWMGLATVFMIIEKLPQIGHYVTKPMGAILIAAGVLLALWTPLMGG
jgi:predicted metal-binding membrane protein